MATYTIVKSYEFNTSNGVPKDTLVAVIPETITTEQARAIATSHANQHGYQLPVEVRFDQLGVRYVDLVVPGEGYSHRSLVFETGNMSSVEAWPVYTGTTVSLSKPTSQQE